MLVREQHLVDEAVGEQGIPAVEIDPAEHLERPLPDLLHVRPHLVGAQDRELAPDLPGLLDRVVELPEAAAERLAAADPLDQPEFLEVGDVAQVPDQGTEERVVDPVELLVREGLDQSEGVTARLVEPLGERALQLGSGTTSTVAGGGSNLRDTETLARSLAQLGSNRLPRR
jgi:hypothetical protein